MKLFDKVDVSGSLMIRSYDLQGRLLESREGQNIVVNDGREALARLLGGDLSLGSDLSNWTVDTMKFGDGGHQTTPTFDPTILLPVSVEDDDLYGTEHVAEAVATTWPADRKVMFEATIEASEGNGTGTLEYSEAGLYYNSGAAMFAHKAFGYIVKNDTIKIVAQWTFTF